MDVNPDNAPKFVVIFPTKPGANVMVAVTLVFPMGWKNIPPDFSTTTKIIANDANSRLRNPNYIPPPHLLYQMAAEVVLPPKTMRPLALPPHIAVAIPSRRDPSLPTTGNPLEYVDILVDEFISLEQDQHLWRVRQTLLHTVNHVFCPLGNSDSSFCREPVSLKKLRKGYCIWDTVKLVLGWNIDTTNLTIHLPPHHITWLWEILNSISNTQRRTIM